jgi:hypothetical protein
MKGVLKPFSKSLHATNDPKSRRLVKKFFAAMGIPLKDHPDRYDIDLITEDGEVRVEVERRPVWKTGKFPFKTVHVLERKKKFFEHGKAHYCIISEDYKWMGFISATLIREYMKPEYLNHNPNKFVRSGEYEYDIPTDKFEFYQLSNE